MRKPSVAPKLRAAAGRSSPRRRQNARDARVSFLMMSAPLAFLIALAGLPPLLETFNAAMRVTFVLLARGDRRNHRTCNARADGGVHVRHRDADTARREHC